MSRSRMSQTNHPLDRLRLLLALLAAALLVLVALPGAASAASAPAAEPEAVDAMVDQLGITAAEARSRLADQPAQARTARRLDETLDDAAGTFIDPDSGDLRVNVLDAEAAGQARDAGVVPVRVAHDLDDLEQARRALGSLDAPDGVTWAVDVPSNSLVIGVPDSSDGPATDRFLEDARALDVPVTVETIAGVAAPQAFYGGEAILGASGGRCSAGFVTASRSGRPYLVTAGHCTDGSATWSGDGQVIGNTVRSSFPGNDYGVIGIANPTALDPRGAVLYGSGAIDITGAARVPVGATVCKTGSTTGTTCGQVLRYDVTVNYADGAVGQLTESNTCTQPGDSGGALYAGSQAQGVVSGGSIAGCSASGFRSYFQPIDEALAVYGLTLQ